MTEMIGVADAKRRFSELVDRVGRGERFVVTRRGVPVVALVEPDAAAQRSPRLGLLGLMGVLAHIEGVDEWAATMEEIVAERQSSPDREPPDLG